MPVLRVATWNCQHGKPDPTQLGAAVASLDVDVLAIQEVDRRSSRVGGRDLAADASDAFGGELVWAPALAFPESARGGEYGNALLVRGEVRRAVVIELPRRRKREPRSAVLTEVTAAGRSWTVAATHLTTVRSVVLDQLLALLDVLNGWPAPRVLLGDLNLEPHVLLPWMAAEGYRLALGPPTHSVRRPRRQIDHVAVTGRRCSVVATGARALPVGDHLALLAEVTCGDRAPTTPTRAAGSTSSRP
jgi:endonuclease/exonuclease/phosphatase family metal-dependent hydrolase